MSRFTGWTTTAINKLGNFCEPLGEIKPLLKTNKYGARKKLYNGVLYDSTFEAEYAQRIAVNLPTEIKRR